MMSLQTMFDADRAGDFEARIGFRFGDTFYLAEIADRAIDVRRCMPEQVDVLVTATAEEVAAVLYGGAPLDTMQIEGDRAVIERFVSLFPLPEKVA